MGDKIDYNFLSNLEGGSKLTGYVPAAGVSNSGVTIATGFDLGQRNESDLKKLNLSVTLINKLKPYLGTTKKKAADFSKNNQLKISSLESMEIDKAVKKAHIGNLKKKYISSPYNTKKKTFFALPTEAQTVIASVSFQYGVNLSIRAPKFWEIVSSQDWTEAIKILKNFGDAYPTRRKKEAKLLEKLLKKTKNAK